MMTPKARGCAAFVLGVLLSGGLRPSVGQERVPTSGGRITAEVSAIAESSDLTATVGRQLRQHIAYLASDRLRGRGVAEDTMVLARDYVRDQMAEAGL
ncbi:MAG: hypothetical protein AAF802_28925, partial [Planctomycetota bacterium]